VQSRSGQHPAKATTDNNDLNLFLDRFSFQFAIDVGVFHKVGKLAGDFLILIIAIGAKSFITFFAILAS